MKKNFISLFMAFAFVLGFVAFSGNASANTNTNESIVDIENNSITTTSEEYIENFRITRATFSANRRWKVDVWNSSKFGGEYMIRVYNSGTNILLLEKEGYIDASTTIYHSLNAITTTLKVDIVVYRKGDVNVLGGISADS